MNKHNWGERAVWFMNPHLVIKLNLTKYIILWAWKHQGLNRTLSPSTPEPSNKGHIPSCLLLGKYVDIYNHMDTPGNHTRPELKVKLK